jgi:orc1/cdc6 family replication initiation protein
VDIFKKLEENISKKLDIKSKIYKPGWRKVLDSCYIPKNPVHREKEITTICDYLTDFISNEATGNILIYGNPGTGKTMSFLIAKNFMEKFFGDRGYDNFKIVYVSAKGSSVSNILVDICSALGVKVPARGYSIKDYLRIIFGNRGDTYLHICMDEFDNLLVDSRRKFEDIVYYLTRQDKVSATFITNKLDLAKEIKDARVLSSLDTLSTIYFESYNAEQCYDILKSRVDEAFVEGFIPEESLSLLAEHVANEGGDIRTGLSILIICGKYAEEKGLTRINPDVMSKIIELYSVKKDGENLINTLAISDKIILVAIYSLMLESRSYKVNSKDVFALQDYYRSILGLPSINRESFSVYLSRLHTAGVISIKRIGKGGGGQDSIIELRFPRESIKYMLQKDKSLEKLKSIVEFPNRARV